MPLIEKLINYLKETRVEMKHVNWPTKKMTINFTLLVIAISFAVALYLGFFDKFFSYLLNTFILY
jgi:preprotein translocase SecE subunit